MIFKESKVLLVLYEDRVNFKSKRNIGGVITACLRIIKAHNQLNQSITTYRYTDFGKKNRFLFPLRFLIDLFRMLIKTGDSNYVYLVTDPSSFIRTIFYIILSKILYSKFIIYVDIRGGGPKVRLEGFSLSINQIGLFLIYTLSNKIILQTPDFSKIPNKLRSKAFFLPNTISKSNLDISKLKSLHVYDNSNKIEKTKFKIIYSGRIHESKGIMLILKLFDTYLSDYIDISFIGPIELRDKPRNKFLNLIDKKSINYYGVCKNQSQLLKILIEKHLFIFPSFHKTEGMPNSVLDAVSCKLPILTSNCGFINDLYSINHLTFIDQLTISCLIDSLEEIMKNYNKYLEKANRAYAFSIENYTFSNYLERLKTLYKTNKI